MTYAKNPKKKWYCYNDSSCKVWQMRELIPGGTFTPAHALIM